MIHNFLVMCAVQHYENNHHFQIAYEESLMRLLTWTGNITPKGPILPEKVFDCGFRVETHSFLTKVYCKLVDAVEVHTFKKKSDYQEKMHKFIDQLYKDQPLISKYYKIDLYHYVNVNYKVGI